LLALVGNSLVRIDTLTGEGTFVAYVALEGLCAIAAGERVVSVAEGGSPGQPRTFALSQNFPNPFNPTTTVSYELPAFSDVRLVVFDLLGREAATLVNERMPPGIHTVRFDVSGLASCVYFYPIQAGAFVQTRKLLLLQ